MVPVTLNTPKAMTELAICENRLPSFRKSAGGYPVIGLSDQYVEVEALRATAVPARIAVAEDENSSAGYC